MPKLEPPTRHVFGRDGARRSSWYARYRLPNGRQVQKRTGPAWTDRGRPPAGYFTSAPPNDGCATCSTRRDAEPLPGLVQTGATFADAAAEFLRYAEHDRAIKPSTLTDYRSNRLGAPARSLRTDASRGHHVGEDRAVVFGPQLR